jgi:hypothetical protein
MCREFWLDFEQIVSWNHIDEQAFSFAVAQS